MNSGRLQMPDADRPSPRDYADMDCYYLLLETISIGKLYDKLTPEQARNLRAARDEATAILMRAEQ